MLYAKGQIENSINLRIIGGASSSAPGEHVTGLTAAHFVTGKYAKMRQADQSFALADLSAITDDWESGGFIERASIECYRLDVPNAAFDTEGPVVFWLQPTGNDSIIVVPKEIYVSNMPYAAEKMIRGKVNDDPQSGVVGPQIFTTDLPLTGDYTKRSILFAQSSTHPFAGRTIISQDLIGGIGPTLIQLTLDNPLDSTVVDQDEFIIV